MTLSDIRQKIEKAEAGKYENRQIGNTGQGHVNAMFGMLARDIRNALWQPWAKDEALDLADRAEKISNKYPKGWET